MTRELDQVGLVALGIAREAVAAPSVLPIADGVVLALSDKGLLRAEVGPGPVSSGAVEAVAGEGELAGLREDLARALARVAGLAPFEQLRVQRCELGQHRVWFADVSVAVPCPWCEIARVHAVGPTVFRADRGPAGIGTYASALEAGRACEAEVTRYHEDVSFQWDTDDAAVLHLTAFARGGRWGTGHTVTPVTVLPVYTPEVTA